MARSDGSVIIDTRMNTDGIDRGVKDTRQKVSSLSNSVERLGATIRNSFSQSNTVKAGRSYDELKKEIAKTEAQLDKLIEKQIRFVETGGNKKSRTMAGMEYDIDMARDRLAGLRAELGQTPIETEKATKSIGKNFGRIDKSIKRVGDSAKKTRINILRMLATSVLYSVVFRAISAVVKGFAEGINNLSQYSENANKTMSTLKSSLTQLQNSFATAFMPIITFVTPLLNSFMQLIIKVNNLISQFFSALMGQSSYTKAISVQEDYAKSLNGTASAAKKAKNNLSALDELNIIQKDDSGGGASGGELLPKDMFKETPISKETEDVADKIQKSIEKIKKRLFELSDLFKKGFFDGLGDPTARFESIKKSIDSIKKSLKGIFDAEFFSDLTQFTNTAVESFGKIAGAMTSVGLTIATNLLGGVAGYLESEGERIKDFFLSIFDIQGAFLAKKAEFADTLGFIFEAFAGEDAQQITEDVIAIFANPIMRILEILGKFRNDIYEFWVNPIIESKDQIRTALEGVLSQFTVFSGAVRTVFTGFFDILNDWYDKYISPIFDRLAPKMTELVQQHLLPMIEAFGGMFELLGTGIMFLWQELLMPLFMWLEETFGPIISMWIETLATGFIDGIALMMDAITLLMDGGLATLLKYITDKFSINWTKAWQGIANTFVGIWNKILDAIEWVINGAIKAINKLIDAANSVASAIGLPTLPNIDKIELPRAKIPYLATGAVIPPNAPFMAMLGDQKHGTNLEAPEDLIRQIVREEAGGSREMLDLLMQIAQNTRDTADKDLTIGDREIARANLRGQREMGYTLITEG